MSDLGVRLIRGSLSLDLNVSNSYLTIRDFVPPATAETAIIATGTVQNETGSGAVISKKASPREWSFTVRLIGNSGADLQERARVLRSFLSLAGDDADPLYVEVRTTTDAPIPLWGQFGAPLYYEILHGSVELGEDYSLGARRKHALSATLNLIIQPYAIGKKQQLALATGGILEDKIGATDDLSFGLVIPEATTNKLLNPLFNLTDWDANWATGGSLISAQSTDSRFAIYSTAAAKLTRTASANITFTQSVNVGNTNTHTLSCYAKRDDGAPVTSSDLQLYYGSAQTTVYTLERDGRYRLTATMAGVNAATAAGVVINGVGRSIYVTGFQLEEKGWATPFAFGDLMGNAWSGTFPDQTTIRTAGVVKVPLADMFNMGSGTIRVVVKMPQDSTWGNNITVFARDVGFFSLIYVAASDKFMFSDGTNPVYSAVQSFSAGAIFVLHCTWGASGVAIYVNGVAGESFGTYTPAGTGAYINLGCDNAGTNQANVCLLGFSSFDFAMTSAQVQTDYANIQPLTNVGRRLESIPYFWTRAGDNVTSQYTDSTHHHWGVAGGISGTAKAETEFHILLDNSASGNFDSDGKTFYLSLLDILEAGLLPNNISTYKDEDTTVTDANDVGGKVSSFAATTTESSGTYFYFAYRKFKSVTGRQAWCLVRIRDAGTGLHLRQGNSFGGSVAVSTYKNISADATSRMFLLNPIMIQDLKSIFAQGDSLWDGSGFGIQVLQYRNTGTADVTYDYMFIVFDPLLQIKAAANTGAYANGVGARVNGMRAGIYSGGVDLFNHLAQVMGKTIEFQPNHYNILFAWRGASGSPHVITRTMTFSRIYYTPRWSLL